MPRRQTLPARFQSLRYDREQSTWPPECTECSRRDMTAATNLIVSAMRRQINSTSSARCLACLSALISKPSLYLNRLGTRTVLENRAILAAAKPSSAGMLAAVINLNASTKRMEKMRTRLAAAGVHGYVRINAIYGARAHADCAAAGPCAARAADAPAPLRRHAHALAAGTMLLIKKMERMGIVSTEGAIARNTGSALSHLMIWEHAARTNARAAGVAEAPRAPRS